LATNFASYRCQSEIPNLEVRIKESDEEEEQLRGKSEETGDTGNPQNVGY